MKKLILTFSYLLVTYACLSQYFQATVNENYEYSVQPIQYLPHATDRDNTDELKQIKGFPKAFPASLSTKNFRNVTLEDLDFDGIPEIIFAAKDKLLAFSKGELLWEKSLMGYGIYPPSVADLDNDGQLEIVQATGGPGQPGHVYLMDVNGKDWESWPQSFEDNWILTAPTLSDLDEDGEFEIVFIERISSMVGQIHAVRLDGSLFNNNWPVPVPGTPAVTPSIGDVDNDGEKEIIVYTTTTMYQFDLEGEAKPGWPIENPDTKFSFQAPLLRDLDQDGDLEIIGASHGNFPEFYVVEHDGSPYKNWPIPVPQGSWTYSSPTIVEIDGEQTILMSRPHTVNANDPCLNKDMLYAWKENGEMRDGFPIEKIGGLESGIISVADIDESVDMELIFGSNAIDSIGNGFIHAFRMDGAGEVKGFPLRPKGWTLSNGAALGDVTGDGFLNLVALSYTLNFGAAEDSIFLNIYDLETGYRPENILWNTFKGSNTRDGLSPLSDPSLTSTTSSKLLADITIQPNLMVEKGLIKLHLNQPEYLTGALYDLSSGRFYKTLFSDKFPTGESEILVEGLEAGMYLFRVTNLQNQHLNRKLMVLNN